MITAADQYFQRQARLRPLEIAFWLATLLPFVAAFTEKSWDGLALVTEETIA